MNKTAKKKTAKKKTAKKKTGRKTASGRKTFEPLAKHRKIVRTAAGYGLTHEQIAQLVIDPVTGNPISRQTLGLFFQLELTQGHAQSSLKVTQTAYRLATSGDCPAMTMFWLKTRLKWRETNRMEVTSPSGGPVEMITREMTPDEAADAYRATLDDQEQG